MRRRGGDLAGFVGTSSFRRLRWFDLWILVLSVRRVSLPFCLVFSHSLSHSRFLVCPVCDAVSEDVKEGVDKQ